MFGTTQIVFIALNVQARKPEVDFDRIATSLEFVQTMMEDLEEPENMNDLEYCVDAVLRDIEFRIQDEADIVREASYLDLVAA